MAVMIGLSSFLLRAKRAEKFLALLPGDKHFRVVNHTHEGACLWPKGGPWPGGPPSLRHCVSCLYVVVYPLPAKDDVTDVFVVRRTLA
jgi:hypothetical protein